MWEQPAAERSLVAPTLLALLLGLGFPYYSGIEILQAPVQLFYSCAAPVYLDFALARRNTARASIAAWFIALAVQAIALAAVRVKTGHWIAPSPRFAFGIALCGLGVALMGWYAASDWSTSTIRQTYMFLSIALFLFWGMTPEFVQAPVNALLLTEYMPWSGAGMGIAAASLGWVIWGRTWGRTAV